MACYHKDAQNCFCDHQSLTGGHEPPYEMTLLDTMLACVLLPHMAPLCVCEHTLTL